MDLHKLFASWPVARQLGLGGGGERPADHLGLGRTVQSRRSAHLTPRTDTADKVVGSICPYCAVGCGQRIYIKTGRDGEEDRVTQIEGDPASPISRGRLCPKGSASRQLVDNPLREYKVKYRRPYGEEWEDLDLETAMDMIADRVIKTREETWQDVDSNGGRLRRTLGLASLGGATLDNEENYLMKKLYTALGAIEIENQARI